MSQEVELWGVPEGMVETEDGKKPGTKQGSQEMGVRGGEISFSEKMATEVFLCPRVLPAPCQKRGLFLLSFNSSGLFSVFTLNMQWK